MGGEESVPKFLGPQGVLRINLPLIYFITVEQTYTGMFISFVIFFVIRWRENDSGSVDVVVAETVVSLKNVEADTKYKQTWA